MIPHPLRHFIVAHDVYTVAYMKWDGLKNGRLPAATAGEGFDAMVTRDRGLPFQQNSAGLPLAVVVLRGRSEAIDDIPPLIPLILTVLDQIVPRTVAYID